MPCCGEKIAHLRTLIRWLEQTVKAVQFEPMGERVVELDFTTRPR